MSKKISFADTDTCIMGKKGDLNHCYYGQISVDADLASGKDETILLSPLVSSERKRVKADFIYYEPDCTYTFPGEQTIIVVRHGTEEQKIYQGHARSAPNALTSKLLSVPKERCAYAELRRPRAVAAVDERKKAATGCDPVYRQRADSMLDCPGQDQILCVLSNRHA